MVLAPSGGSGESHECCAAMTRSAGIKAMARLRIEEGIPLTIMMMRLTDWGKAYIIGESLDVLKQYRGAARSALPELKKMEVEFRKMKKEHDKLVEVIAIIEKDTNPPELISLKDFLKNGKAGRPGPQPSR